MALLTGTLYTKKSYGKKIFGELVQTAIGSTDDKADVEAKRGAIDASQPATKEETQVHANQDIPEKEMFPREGGGDVKVTWKSAVAKAKRPSKDFFSPKDESGEPDVETEKDVTTVESTDKRMKRKLPPPSLKRPSFPSRTARTGAKLNLKLSTSKEGTSKEETKKKTEEQANEKKHTDEPPSDKSGDESESEDTALDITDTEEPSRKVLETVTEEADEDLSDSVSENSSKSKGLKKPIFIKAVKSNKAAEQASGSQAEEAQSLDVLHPDAIVNLKRELARKGIIRNYEDVEMLDQPSSTEVTETEAHPKNEISETSDDISPNKRDVRDDVAQVEDEQNDDGRDGFKTNKSFEIRRLQAKAERDRDDKGPVFSKAKFTRGARIPTSLNRTPDENDTRYDEHRKNWIRKKPKSILKPRTDDDSRDRKRRKNDTKRKSATVRIREPGYGDYKLYSAEESDASSDSVISQSSSVLGYRPNSATSLSSESSMSFADDGSFDSDAVQDFEDEEAFYRASALGRSVHDIYDDIDRLNPSRLTNVRFTSPFDGYEHQSRVASADNSYVDRSSLHILRGNSRQSQRMMRKNSAIRSYEEKPLQLFDAMRYSNETAKRRGKRNIEGARNLAVPSGRRTTSREKRQSSREGARAASTSRQSQRNPFPGGAIAFGPDLYPISPEGDPTAGGISEKEWVDRAQKFFATANAGRRKQAQQRKRLSKPGILKRFNKIFKRKKRRKRNTKKMPKDSKQQQQQQQQENKEEYILAPLCYCDCCPSCCSIFFCETSSLWSSIVLIFLPSAVISTLVILALFWGVGIFSIT